MRAHELMQLGALSDDVMNMQTALAKYGYGIPVTGRYDDATMEVVSAFQRHFRPAKVDGICDRSTMETLHALLSSLPIEAMNVLGSLAGIGEIVKATFGGDGKDGVPLAPARRPTGPPSGQSVS